MGRDRRAYRTPALLCAAILLGWLWDLSLGGGRSHTVAWLLALVLVGGISGLSARARSRRPVPNVPLDPGEQPATAAPIDDAPDGSADNWTIRTAEPAEYEQLIEVEIAADQLFPLAGYGETPGPATVAEFAASRCVLVIGDPAVGFARITAADGRAHLESLSVRPRFMRQGRGAALVRAACDWAAAQGDRELTLCTFAEVPWNGPFYTGLGFAELTELGPDLRALRETERRLGLDAMGRRVVLRKRLTTEHYPPNR